MDYSGDMTQKQFQNLLLYIYNRVQKTEKLEVKDLLKEIIQQIDTDKKNDVSGRLL